MISVNLQLSQTAIDRILAVVEDRANRNKALGADRARFGLGGGQMAVMGSCAKVGVFGNPAADAHWSAAGDGGRACARIGSSRYRMIL